MKSLKALSTKTIYISFAVLFSIISTGFLTSIILVSGSITKLHPEVYQKSSLLIVLSLIYIVTFLLIGLTFIWFMRIKVVQFSDEICEIINKLISQEDDISFDIQSETLTSKLQNKIKHLTEIIKNQQRNYIKEKDVIKSLISDISHQIKTPLANLSIYNSTLLERELTEKQRLEFLESMKSQILRLEWLMGALIKMSRLESGIISLKKSLHPIEETIAEALGDVYIKAEQKDIDISIQCDSSLKIPYDKKWLREAIFNVLENAVKYTEKGGQVGIKVTKGEMFTSINITDNGIGLEECEINNIFKRFYRGAEVAQIEGSGIGLYIVREILRNHGGYIKVKSKKGMGSTFSLFVRV